ncbi:MAG: flagellar hook-basal body complex protein FliE [Bacteriovoracaceae bacterium]
MIKTVAGMKETLNSYSANDWIKSAEVGQTKFAPGNITGHPNPTQEVPKSFGEFLSESIGKVNSLQQEANVAMEKLATGESKNIHETLLAVEQADIAYRSMNQIRMKVIDAYKEIMKMQV